MKRVAKYIRSKEINNGDIVSITNLSDADIEPLIDEAHKKEFPHAATPRSRPGHEGES
jgi:hypothetical protein